MRRANERRRQLGCGIGKRGRPGELGQERRGEKAGPSGRKLRREKISIFFSFSNISNSFSNSF
jgi:hypothetical protein